MPASALAPVNIGCSLSETARRDPHRVGVAAPGGRDRDGRRVYEQLTFAQLDEDSDRLAAGLQTCGMRQGARIVLLVRPGLDFISLVFAMFKAGLVIVLIDPGMGRRNLIRCLEEVQPDGFIAISLVQAVRSLLRQRFPRARHLVTHGRRWFWGGSTVAQLRRMAARPWTPAATSPHDPAAIIFTTGSTGVPKGVLYTHGNFQAQVEELRECYQIEPGEIDLPGFPLFALFNAAMGVTTVIPEMDFTRPAQADPHKILEAARDWQVTQAFGSPALWNTVARFCEKQGVQVPTLRRVLSAGAPVPPHVLERVRKMIPADGEIYTPYGATEALPVASIGSREVLEETAARSREGAGTCVGRRFPRIEWKVIRITDEPLPTMDEVEELPRGQIGELIVQGPVVTREYVTRTEANLLHKIDDGEQFWHRMGDVGYLDRSDRFWFCGRKTHRVLTAAGPMYTIPCEAIFNRDPRIYRSALVGIGPVGQQEPVIIVEPWPEALPPTARARGQLARDMLAAAHAHPLTENIHRVLIHPQMPVDIRHNAKIFREQLAVWAAAELYPRGRPRWRRKLFFGAAP